jgi:hypothetical protein
MSTAPLNFDGVQMEGARRRCDPYLRALVDQLDDAYYGTPNPDGSRQANGWRSGVSQPFFLWDYVAGQDNKLKFDLLSGILHHLTFLAQHLFNQDHRGQNATDPEAQYDKYPEPKYNEIRSGPPGATVIVESKVRQIKRWLRDMATQWNAANLTPVMNRARFNQIVTYIRNRPRVAELIARRPALDAILDIDNETDIST